MSEWIARLIFAFTLVVAAAFWARGYAAVGDGFSAGGTAGLGAVVQYVCRRPDAAARFTGAAFAPALIVAGLAVAVVTLLVPSWFGLAPVTHWPPPGGEVASIGVLELHTVALMDLGIAALVYGALVLTFDRIFPRLQESEP
jgi:hypothetical protein